MFSANIKIFWKNLREQLLVHKLSLGLTAFSFLLSIFLLLSVLGLQGLSVVPLVLFGVSFSLALIVCLTKGLQYFFLMLARYKPDSPIRFMATQTKLFFQSGRPFYSFLAIALLFTFFAAGFSINKAMIPRLHPFSWDPFFTQWDYKLHFSAYPHEYFVWLSSNPFFLMMIDIAYQTWFYLYYLSIFYASYLFYNRPETKVYFLANCLTWFFGGNILALIFSSAGPIYAEYLAPNPLYEEQLQLLRSSQGLLPNMALIVREKLWTSLQVNGLSSISAFPSMHVGSTVLMTIASFYTGSKKVFSFMLFYAFLIFTGSIVLTWHYAVDGYAGALIAGSCWLLAKKLLLPQKERAPEEPLIAVRACGDDPA